MPKEEEYYSCLECNDDRGANKIPERHLLHLRFRDTKGRFRKTVLKCPYCRGHVRRIVK